MNERLYIYLVFSEESPDEGRLFRSRLRPGDLVEPYEADNPGWYVRDVWSVTSEADAAVTMSMIRGAFRRRHFEESGPAPKPGPGHSLHAAVH